MITAFRANLCKRKEAVGHLYTRSAIQHWLSAKIVSVTFSYLEPASGQFLTVASKAAGSIWPALACRQAGRPSQAKSGHPDRFPLLGPQVSPPQPKPPIHSGSQENCLHMVHYKIGKLTSCPSQRALLPEVLHCLFVA